METLAATRGDLQGGKALSLTGDREGSKKAGLGPGEEGAKPSPKKKSTSLGTGKRRLTCG
ncbi:hypothetical protein FAK_10280 [Desulfoferula mesophila]|uniref:Uncharacterized protein n=1 Tax=Desulfoferula mesophila TaxID=3058419 RepID=A0AAU9F1D4_9BACT|nr:hypothetical protein FAK_10280 [Desulfoferula mesophilus]